MQGETQTGKGYRVFKVLQPAGIIMTQNGGENRRLYYSAHLHLRPLGWGNLGVIHLNLSFWHLVERLVHDPQGLSHLLHSAQIPEHHAENSGELQTLTTLSSHCQLCLHILWFIYIWLFECESFKLCGMLAAELYMLVQYSFYKIAMTYNCNSDVLFSQ